MRAKNNLWRRIILAAVLLGLILAGFFVYLSSNRWRTLERNANYIADAATQSAKRIDDLLISAENTTGPRMPEYLTQRLVEEGGTAGGSHGLHHPAIKRLQVADTRQERDFGRTRI